VPSPDAVTGFDGFIAKYMGDGVLIYFGYPRAHEDDAERAVRAGLGLIDAVGRLDVKSVKLDQAYAGRMGNPAPRRSATDRAVDRAAASSRSLSSWPHRPPH
jgi:hypothetical protein